MAYDERLAERVRDALGGLRGLTERKMFGGIAFMLNGNMCVGVHGDELIVRVAPETHDEAVRKPGVRTFDITGRPMQGWLLVSGAGTKGAGLASWVQRGVEFSSSMPAKKGKRKPAR